MSPSHDKKVHTVEIECESNSEIGKQVFKTVERPVCPVEKLMEVNDTGLIDDINNVQEAVDVENLAHRIDYRAHDVLENDEGVAAEDNLNWFFYAHYNGVDAEETNELAISNAASEPVNNCLYRDAELLKYRHLKFRS